MTQPWVSADTEIWGFDAEDSILWYPDTTASLVWDLLGNYEACSPELGLRNSGYLDYTHTNDDLKLILNEMYTTPGFCYNFYHFQVPDPSAAYFLQFRGTYGGNTDHYVQFQAFNFDTTAYVTFLTLQTSTFTQDYFANIPTGAEYFDGDTLLIRTYHPVAGIKGHLFRINYWRLHEGSV